MPVLLVLVFVGVPLLEIVVILQVGAVIGGWPTVAILVADSILGAWLLRVEGARAWWQFRRALNEGRWPGDEVAQGALIIVGGTLLVTPGFITDIVGFAFLLRPTRRLVAGRLRRRVGRATGVGDGADRAGGRGPDRDAGPRRRGGAGRRTGGGTGRGASGRDLDLDVEVVEIERAQPPNDPPLDDAGEDPDGPMGPPHDGPR